MKANELRIGNWVLFSEDSTVFEVKSIEEKWLELHNEEETSWISSEELGPIPLTEEWLLKFGFEKTENGWLRLTVCNDWSYLYWERLAGFSLSVDKHGISLPYIKNVHQLQNLYFALTGEELTDGGNK